MAYWSAGNLIKKFGGRALKLLRRDNFGIKVKIQGQ